jgi:hypothetical protein
MCSLYKTYNEYQSVSINVTLNELCLNLVCMEGYIKTCWMKAFTARSGVIKR